MTIAHRDDETFKQSLAELARRAGERLARQSAADPGAAAQARRSALLAYDRARTRRLRWAVGFAAGLIAGTGVAALVSILEPSPAPVSAGVTPAEPVPAVESASVAPAPGSAPSASTPEVPSPSPARSAIEPAAPSAAPPAATASNDQAPAPGEAALERDEVREVQVKLRSFGFNPGPIDGIAGRTTEGAVLNYQQKRELPQTGKLDRQLLDQLRQDPTPQVPQQFAQRAPRPDPRPPSAPPAPRRSDPLQPLKNALDGAGRWIDSLVR
jgi:hypothetical protein